MQKGYVLYNLNAVYETHLEEVKLLEVVWDNDLEFIDITKITDYTAFSTQLNTDEFVVICGGDGTLNRFINDTESIEYICKVFYYPFGTGNDFASDLGYSKGCNPFEITDYIKNLPTVTVNGKTTRFLNGVGYGIDGYCCEVGDEIKKTSTKK